MQILYNLFNDNILGAKLTISEPLLAFQKEAEIHLVEARNFEVSLSNSWEKHYSGWPNKSYFMPAIFIREVREVMKHEKPTPDKFSTEDIFRVKQLENKQTEEDMKEILFEKLQRLSVELREQLRLFVISNMKIDEMMSSHLSCFIRADFVIPKNIELDFIVFTSKSEIILIRFSGEDVEGDIRDLNEGFRFIKDLQQRFPNASSENLRIGRILVAAKTLHRYTNTIPNEIQIFTQVTNLLAYINDNIKHEVSIPAMLPFNVLECLKTLSFIRATTCIRVSEDVRLVESDLTEPTMLENVTARLEEAKISESPVYLKNAITHVRLRKTQLSNLSPQQLELLETRKKTILLLGAAGTGKTLVTKLKLLNHLQDLCELSGDQQANDIPIQKKVAVFVPENMLKEYEQFIEENIDQHLEIQTGNRGWRSILQFYSLSRNDYLDNLKVALQAGASIFIADSQHFYQFQRMFVLIDVLRKWRNDNKEAIIWIALDWLQFLIEGPLAVKSLTIPEWLFPDGVFYLDLVMRNTTQIMKLAAALQEALQSRFTSSEIPQDTLMQAIIGIESARQCRIGKNEGGSASKPGGGEHSADKKPTQAKGMFSNAALEGHKIAGMPIQLYVWKAERAGGPRQGQGRGEHGGRGGARVAEGGG